MSFVTNTVYVSTVNKLNQLVLLSKSRKSTELHIELVSTVDVGNDFVISTYMQS